MTTTTDLLRKAARLHEGVAKSAEHRGEPPAVVDGLRRDAASLLALADQMERAEPVANENAPPTHDFNVCDLDGPSRKWAHKQGMTDETKLYTHPAQEVTRDAEQLRKSIEAAAFDWAYAAYLKGADRPYCGHLDISAARANFLAALKDALQEPKP